MTENLLEKVAIDTNGTSAVVVGENTIDFKAPYPRITLLESHQNTYRIDVSLMDEKQLRSTAEDFGIKVDDTMGEG